MGPSSESNPSVVPDEASAGERISGPSQSGQPGKAVGHAVGKLTLRDDLAEVWVKATARSLAPRRDTTSVEPLTARGVSDRVFSTSVAPM